MKMMVIKGKVVGGHYLKDLGLRVAFEQEVSIPADRATFSSDLSYALSQKLVEKVGYKNLTAQNSPPILPVKSRKEKASTKELPVKSEEPIERAPEVNAEIQELRNQVSLLVKTQQELLNKLSDSLQNPSVVYHPTPSNQMGSNKISVTVNSEEEWEEDYDDEVFIPSTIRSKDVKISSEIEAVQEESESSSKMEEASALLASMKKKKKGSSK